MIKVKKPSAIIYGWDRIDTTILKSDVYFEENLIDDVVLYPLEYTGNVELDYSKYQTDLIIFIGDFPEIKNPQISDILIKYNHVFPDNIIANDIVCQSVFRGCKNRLPKFSIFTPAYKTGEKIRRTYEGLRNQTFIDWQWIVLDDSPDNETWEILQGIALNDFRVKPYKMFPITGGNVGLAKHRACMLCDGEWLVELDHDDYLLSKCLEECHNASLKYPDAGFIYTDCCELYENGSFRSYSSDWSGNWKENRSGFAFGYAGHVMTEVDGKEYLWHQCASINPLTIRFNISMPNHTRIWRKDIYHKINGHNKKLPVADDLELIIKTFLETRMIHVKKLLYLQYNNGNSTVDNNARDINRRARLIRDHYDLRIHERIEELGNFDWNWIPENNHSYKTLRWYAIPRYGDDEELLNYIYE
jgi:glycosyltransferase involved in cell wall biosynthesis